MWPLPINAYKGLFKIEKVFRELKSYLEIQPIYHFAERRIEAHIFLCFLALLLEWELAPRVIELNVVPTSSFTLKNAYKQ